MLTLLAVAPIAIIAAILGVTFVGAAMAFGKKRTVSGDAPIAEHAVLTGTVGDFVYQVERVGSQYRWAVSGPSAGASAESSSEAALRTAFGFMFSQSAKEASVTGALGPYTFTVDLQEGGQWRWIASDLGGGGAASAEQGTMGSRGASTIRAFQWLVERGAAEWLAVPGSLPEDKVGGGAPPAPKKPPKQGGLAPKGAPQGGAQAGAAQVQGEPIFPGLVLSGMNVHLTDARAWAAYARPRLAAAYTGGVGAIIQAAFGEEPGPKVTFNGKPWPQVKAKLIEAVGRINQPTAAYIPAPDEWLANLVVGYYPMYKGAAQYYKGHALVSRPGPAGVVAQFSWRWYAWEGRRGLDDQAEHEGVGSSAMDGLKRAKVQVDAEG